MACSNLVVNRRMSICDGGLAPARPSQYWRETHGRSHLLSVVAPGKICRAVAEPLGDAAGDGEQHPGLLARRLAIDNGGRSHDHDRRLHLVAVVKNRCAQGADTRDGPVPDRGKASTADSLELGSQLSERRPALTASSRQFRLELRQDQPFRHECRKQLPVAVVVKLKTVPGLTLTWRW